MSRAAALLTPVLASLSLAACALWSSSPEHKPASIVAAPGEQFTIVLDANHSTGFRWELGKPPEAAVATLTDTQYEQEPNAAVGAGGNEVWTFAAVAPGWTTIQLVYRRPWEEMVPARIAEYAVDVR